jgi:hypothetical protein
MGKINAQWHRAHVMPKNPTESQRAEWHYEHARHCGCRAVTASIAALLEANGYEVPRPLSRKPSPDET